MSNRVMAGVGSALGAAAGAVGGWALVAHSSRRQNAKRELQGIAAGMLVGGVLGAVLGSGPSASPAPGQLSSPRFP
jgi:hypothetical protein